MSCDPVWETTILTPISTGRGDVVFVLLYRRMTISSEPNIHNCQTQVSSPDFSLGTRSWLCFPLVAITTRSTLTKIYQMEEMYRSCILHTDLTWWKTAFDGRQLLMEDDLWWKTAFDGRWPLEEDLAWYNLWWKTAFPDMEKIKILPPAYMHFQISAEVKFQI